MAELIGEAEAEELERWHAEARAHADTLRSEELEGWAELAGLFEQLVEVWDTRVVAKARELEALRVSIENAAIRRELVGPVRPFPLTFRDLLGKLHSVAYDVNGIRSTSFADEERHLARLLPDLRRRALETVALTQMEAYRDPLW